jgi:hypothetical protein
MLLKNAISFGEGTAIGEAAYHATGDGALFLIGAFGTMTLRHFQGRSYILRNREELSKKRDEYNSNENNGKGG